MTAYDNADYGKYIPVPWASQSDEVQRQQNEFQRAQFILGTKWATVVLMLFIWSVFISILGGLRIMPAVLMLLGIHLIFLMPSYALFATAQQLHVIRRIFLPFALLIELACISIYVYSLLISISHAKSESAGQTAIMIVNAVIQGLVVGSRGSLFVAILCHSKKLWTSPLVVSDIEHGATAPAQTLLSPQMYVAKHDEADLN